MIAKGFSKGFNIEVGGKRRKEAEVDDFDEGMTNFLESLVGSFQRIIDFRY